MPEGKTQPEDYGLQVELDPAAPSLAATFPGDGSAEAVALVGNQVYLADGAGGLMVLGVLPYGLYLPAALQVP